MPQNITALCDTGFAGCQRTRRSTSGGIAMNGGHNLKLGLRHRLLVAFPAASQSCADSQMASRKLWECKQSLKTWVSLGPLRCIAMQLPQSASPAEGAWAVSDILMSVIFGCKRSLQLVRHPSIKFSAQRIPPTC